MATADSRNGKGPTMQSQQQLRDVTESYLTSLIAEVSGLGAAALDTVAPFGEMGITSFDVLKITRRLETDFGVLPKSLLFEHFHVSDLAGYFLSHHAQTLAARFTNGTNGANGAGAPSARNGHADAAHGGHDAPHGGQPVHLLERDAAAHPELGPLVQGLFDRYKFEGSVSRGTRRIAPYLFIGSARRGYLNYGRSKNLVLIYSYAGPPEYKPALLEEMYRYCEASQLQLNVLNDEELPAIDGRAFSATPFGVMQRIVDLKDFTLEGAAMRRLRYLVSKFQKSGECRTEEYRCGSDPETDKQIVTIIDRWCEGKTMVNPLVHDVRGELLAGTLPAEHRLFLTWLDGVLQNAILITAMSSEQNGYLMDMEFYPPEMPLGGLEFAIVQLIATLAAEGYEVLSLGGTYGCKIEPSASADAEIEKILDELRQQNIFNGEGNLQFKNKFRPITRPILLCRPVGSGSPDNVIDIIMMIADPAKTQAPAIDHPDVGAPPRHQAPVEKAPVEKTLSARHVTARADAVERVTVHEAVRAPLATEGDDRARILEAAGFNPLNIPLEQVEIDLKTDSWAQLEMPAIDARMRQLHEQLQRPTSVDDSVRAVFPFAHILLTASGQAAERLLFKAWPKPGIVPQNLLFPSTIFHLIDNGFTPKELPCRELFRLASPEPYKGNMDWEALQAHVAEQAAATAFVCVDVCNNATGGQPVSMQQLRDVKALLAEHAIPLVIDGTRIVENARFLVEHEATYAGQSPWTVAREMLSYADIVFGSLTKDFGVKTGGLVATNDVGLFRKLQELEQDGEAGLDLVEKKLIALSLQHRPQIDAGVAQRMESVRRIWQALHAPQVPVVHPVGGHCILIDVGQIPEFKALQEPVASFLAWLYAQTGIRAAAHGVGMQRHAHMKELVRLAIPVGLPRDRVDAAIERLVGAFARMVDIPAIVMDRRVPQLPGGLPANYTLDQYHNRSSSRPAAAPTAVTRREAAVVDNISAEAVSGDATVKTIKTSPRRPEEPRRTEDIAIVGMAGRYPKSANMRELWENLARGRDCIDDLPADRYERRLRYGNFERYRGGFIDDVERFDSMFFNISPREAEMLDPQERLFLEVAWEAIEDAGYYPEILAQEDPSRNIAVFVGAVWALYQIAGVDAGRVGEKIAPNSFLWSIANRVSYWMNLSGPSLTVDTACSSSLTALYLACEAIRAGECSAAIVGGVNLDLHQAKLDINRVGGALSADGVCRSFGKGANGYVAGEGVGALFLKPLDQAVRDGDQIRGVIKSAVVNHGGRTSGYFVPNPAAQGQVIRSALRKANIDARSIGYVEAHGTGTELGDPIEIAGLSQAFGADSVAKQACAVGSIKSNIGHLEAAAGIVSVSKVLLQMQHRQLVPSLHTAELNGFIDFKASPFYVVQQVEDWTGKDVDGVRLPLRAGISSFGAGGANAHIVLESYERDAQARDESGPPSERIYPLSARTEDQLREMAVRLKTHLQQHDVDLKDAAYTLQQGRKSFEHRVAILARTREELIDRLTGFIDGRKVDDVVVGHVKQAEGVTRLLNRQEKQELVRLLSQSGDPRRMAALWTEGLLADWQGFQANGSGRRISLPTYPFAGKRHWIGDPLVAAQPHVSQAASLHPMIDSNESTFERQIFKKTFHDRDFFIYDHRVSDIPTLPGVAYLELARKAGELAAGRPVRRIQNILWVSPIAVQHGIPKEVFIELKPNGAAVQFEVFSLTTDGDRTLHSQGKLLYTNRPETGLEPEYVNLDALRARCPDAIDGRKAYPLFKSFGLNLGPSFQILQDVHNGEKEALGLLALPEFRQADLQNMVLHPSIVDGALQAGMAARLGTGNGDMLVPFSIGEVEILHPLQTRCVSYTTEATDGKRDSLVLKSNVLILDETGKVLVKIRESTGVPLRDVHKTSGNAADADGFATLFYSYDWQRAPLVAADASEQSPRSMLLFDTDGALRDRSLARRREAGGTLPSVILVRPGEAFRECDEQSYEIDPRSREDFTRLLATLADRNRAVDDICFAWPVRHAEWREEGLLTEALEQGVCSFLFLCQAVTTARLEGVQLLYLYSTRPGAGQPPHDAASGFVNTLRGEYPKLLSKTIEIRAEDGADEQMLDALWSESCARTQDAVVRYASQERFVRKLTSVALEDAAAAGENAALDDTGGAASPRTVVLREHGVYLITGGAGGLGVLFGEFLAKQHRARLILTGRSSLSAAGEIKLDALRKAGAEVLYVQADVSKRADVRKLVDEGKSRFGAIHGVIHAAGVVRDSYIKNKTLEEMRAVFAPKVHGTVHLDEATKDDALDFFVMFSSLAAVTGNPGQADYSFANAFMDSFAAERERLRATGARSGQTVSVNWPLWADGAMKPDEQTVRFFEKSLGMRPLSAATGLQAFVRGLLSGRSQFAVIDGIREKVERAWAETTKSAAAAAAPPASSSGQAVAAPAGDGRDDALVAWLQDELSQIAQQLLKLDASDVSPDKILLDLGFDSIGLTTFANAVNERLDLDITPILFFDYPSIDAIAKHLTVERRDELTQRHRGTAPAGQTATPPSDTAPATDSRPAAVAIEFRKGWDPAVAGREAPGRDPTSTSSAAPSARDLSPELRFVNNPIAIVGISGVMPQSEDLEEFWDNLKNSKNLITLIPPERWRWEDYDGDPLKEANKSNSKWGGFMKEVDKFDPLFFGISPREAQMMDPQQRSFLEHVWKAVEDSGQKVSELAGTKTGVFVGVATNDYLEVITGRCGALDGYSASGNSHSVLANRVSFLLGLRGPSAPLDTACSSSLVALHRAIESIHTGSCEMAIVGGVHVMLSPAAYISFSMAGMLSNDGSCKTFDKRANGYVRGEGCGALFLKSLSAAEADGNHIYAVIKATAENHGGRVTALTAPNSVAQAELLIDAYEKGQIDPTTVGYIECHGTGTSLGDPIEVQALSKAFAELYKKHGKAPAETPHCGLSSVKTNIGHLETAAGIASVLKALLAIKHRQIPATLHLEEVNPYINLKGTPFYIADKLTPWDAPRGADGVPGPRRAGVSSFGFGGANAHVVLEEYIPARRSAPAAAHEPRLIVLSAKNDDRLQAYVRALHAYLGRTEVELADLAFTLQAGRDAMPARLAVVVSSLDDLTRKLGAILEGGERPRDSFRGHAGKTGPKAQAASGVAGDDVVRNAVEQRDLVLLAEQWVAGATIDWRSLYRTGLPRRISAPTYPFARERHWVDGAEDNRARAPHQPAAAAAEQLHPLVHRNVSTFEEQKFAARLSGDEFFLTDHVVETQKILPGVAYLEMARAAGELAAHANVRVIRNLIWERPLIVGRDGKEVEISLTPFKDNVKFAVRTMGVDAPITHCTGELGYDEEEAWAERVDIAAIRQRCREEVVSRTELYAFLNGIGLQLGRGFQIVRSIYANESESLAILELPEHLRAGADRFWLHPALMDGSLHTAIGLMKANGMDVPMSLPYSVGEMRIFQPLRDLYYGYATWGRDSRSRPDRQKISFSLLDEHGNVLVRLQDFVTKPIRQGATTASLRSGNERPRLAPVEEGDEGGLQKFVPVWNPIRLNGGAPSLNGSASIGVPESSRILLVGDDRAPLDWVQQSYPGAQYLELPRASSVASIAQALAGRSFDQLIWLAPDADLDAGIEADSSLMVGQQEEGVLAVFRIIKALLQLGYGSKALHWTLITSRTQRVTGVEPLQPAHAAIVGLVGSLAKEYPQWKLRLLDLDSLARVSARECLSLPWDKQGDPLAHRHGDWFQQSLARVVSMPDDPTPAYRRGGVYVVIGGAGGVGEVWSRFMIERYQAHVVWIGRRACNAAIEAKIAALSRLGPAPVYISADATDVRALAAARTTILNRHPDIHGVVHSAIVLRDQSLSRMDEPTFMASLSAKIDVSVSMDQVFGKHALDFMLFFSSIVSVVKPPGQSNYAAGCTFKDSFAHRLQQQRAYPVKIMNWGYWGDVGVVADETYNALMRQMGIGSIEPREGMAALQALLGSETRQLALVKTLTNQAPPGLDLSEAITFYPRTTPARAIASVS
jgi:acyl transferase domain-containing protein/tryptophanase/acyl carrier protein